MADEYLYPLGTGLSADQTIARAYDETNNRHRVDAQVTAVIGAVDVAIDAASGDNIAIQDSDGNELNVNTDGSINVIVQDITLDYTNDSVTVYQGTNPWIVSATDLDIRNLTFADDKVDVTGSTVALDVGTLSALENITVQNPAGSGAVNIQDGGNSITVDASDLDIRDLTFAQDKVDVSGSTVSVDNFPAVQDVNIVSSIELETSTTNGALETTQQAVLTELQSVNSELDSQTTQLTAANSSLDAIELDSDLIRIAVQSLDTDFDVALSTRASEATLVDVRTELQTANTRLDAIEADAEAIRLQTIDINSELDSQTAILTEIENDTDQIITELQTANTSLDNIESDADAIRVETVAINAELDAQTIQLTAANASLDNIEADVDAIRLEAIDINSELNTQTVELQAANASLNDIEARLETFDTNVGTTTVNTLRTSSNITDETGSAFTDVNYLPVGQTTHDSLNLNANLQVSNVDVSNTNPVPVSGNIPTGTNTIMPISGVEPGNSSTALLGAGGVFTGTWFNAESFVSIDVIIKTDVNSALDGAAVDYSYDGVSITRTIVATVVGSSNGIYFSVPREAKFFRVRYTNGATPQTTFTLQTLLSSTISGLAAIPIGASLTNSTTALISRSVITGEGPETGIYINKKATGISTANSTAVALGSGATFTGPWEDVSGYATISVICKANVASATDGLKLELSTDGVTVHNDDLYTVAANSGKVFSVPAYGKYFRVRYTNGGTAQSSFAIQTKYFVDYPKPSSHRIDNQIISQDDAELVKAVITGQRPDGSFTNIDTTTAGNLKVSVQEFDPAVFGQETMANSLPVVIASDQSTINVNTEGIVAAQTTANLGIAGIYTSATIDTKDFGTIIVSSFANVAGSFTVEWSIDQVTWRSDGDIYTTTANVLKTSTYGPKYRYLRGVYTNGGTAQTTFEFQIVLKRNHTKPSSHKASEAFNDSTDLEGVKAVVAGKAPNGTYVNWTMTNGGSGKVQISEFDTAVTNYGVATGALRTASQIGNVTGAADFNSGLSGAQTLRTASNSYAFDGTNSRQVSSDTRGHQNVLSRVNTSGVFGSLTVGTTAVELKVGASPLTDRISATLHNNSLVTLYWGYSNAVTTSTGTPIFANQFYSWDIGPGVSIFIIAATAGNNTRITEGS